MKTLHDALNEYENELKVTAKSSTVRFAAGRAVTLLTFFGSWKRCTDLTRADIHQFARAEQARGVSNETINGCLRVLRAALRASGQSSAMVKLLKVEKRLASVLSMAQVDRLYETAKWSKPQWLGILLFAGEAGLRRQEILHLTPGDVGTEEVAVTGKDGWTPKAHQERVVPIDPQGPLGDWIARSGASWSASWVFTGRGNRRQASFDVGAVWRPAGLYAPGEKPGLHQLRRSWATALHAAGTDDYTLMRMGGWADLATMQRYLGTTAERMREAIRGRRR